ncbi:hypothetical protein H634G_05683 [Metarhizium anisopliae BRIP 53293]|uniref:RNA polymerase I-specific transcription initiation factor n=1 Tax=Metarhizium anisopliae BRIP 53293 TaxID=1291518 RepID=A0A0D9NXW1_METAN|nr:hypothetical protein H634G_05683 [Metarhizium anisopliae BRIP 53293]
MDDVKLEVRAALEDHLRGNGGQYDMLKELFAKDRQRYLPPVVGEDDDTLKPYELQVYVMALTSCIPILKGKECSGLVRTILQCSWLGRDAAFAKVFTHFLAALVSAQGSYLVPVLSMMVEKFRDSRPSAWSVPDFPKVSRAIMRDRLHSGIEYILQMFPSAVAVLENLLSSKFPFPDESVRVHMAYIHNLLQVKKYVPDLQDEILDLILNRVVKIDSQMQVDLEDLDDDVTAAVMYALRENQRQPSAWEDDDSDDSDNESIDSEDLDYDQEAARIKAVKDSVEKMDAVLDTLFSVYSPHFVNPGSDNAFDMFTTILREFDHMVLPTLVRTMFTLLLHHLEQYRRKYEPLCRGPDLKRFHPYYSLVQATLYIFCFRWQDLVVSAPEVVDPEDPASYIGQDLEWIGTSRKDLSVQIFGKLNPLKVCAPVIVDEFAKLAHRLNFVYIYPLVESNKRVRLTQFLSATYSTGGALRDAGYEGQGESYHQLDPYFPFDPYQLPISKRWLADDYVHWKSVPGLNQDNDDDDESDGMEEEDDNEELVEETATDTDGDHY